MSSKQSVSGPYHKCKRCPKKCKIGEPLCPVCLEAEGKAAYRRYQEQGGKT
jgi:hypothetical protein